MVEEEDMNDETAPFDVNNPPFSNGIRSRPALPCNIMTCNKVTDTCMEPRPAPAPQGKPASNLCRQFPSHTVISATLAHLCVGCHYEETCTPISGQTACADHPYCTGSCSGEVDATFNCSAEQHDAAIATKAREEGINALLAAIENRFEDTNRGRGVVGTIRGLADSLREAQQ